MNHVYMIGKITNISDVIIDYYDKCKPYVRLTVVEKDNVFIVKCGSIKIKQLYRNFKVGDLIYLVGYVVFEKQINSHDIICEYLYHC